MLITISTHISVETVTIINTRLGNEVGYHRLQIYLENKVGPQTTLFR